MAKKRTVLIDKVDDLAPVRERFEKIAELWAADRKRYKEDIKFMAGEHWPADIKAQRDKDGRLTLVVDKLSQYQHQVVNDSRQNRPQIKVRPVDSRADIKTAEIFDGLMRHIQDRSNADTTYDIALECATGGGFGFIRLLHEYAHDDTFEQEICFKPIPNPLQVYFGEHKEPDGSDCKECFIIEEMPIDEFKGTWPDFDIKDWEGSGTKYGDWCGEKVRIAEYYRVVKEPRLLHLLADGTVASDDDYQLALANGVPVPDIKESRNIPINVVKWSKLCGSGYLEKERDTIWKWIPVIPVWGNTQNIDGEVRHVSMIHNAKDAQLLYNYSRSAFAERVGQTPESPWIAAAGQIENYEEDWDGSMRVRVQRYDPIDVNGAVLPAPQRQSPSDIPTGFAKDMELSEHDIQGSLGMYNASLGRRGNASSGIQEREQARKGEIATFHYHDNLARALRHAGRLCVYAIPKVYDSARVVRALGIDGEAQMVHIDPTQPEAMKKVGSKTIYNLGVGTYDVAVAVGPSYQTRRLESAAEMAAVAQRDPNFIGMYGDLYFKSQDWPIAQELSDRAKLLLPPQVQQAESNDEVSPEVATVKAQAQSAITQLQQQLQAAMQELQKLQNAEGSKQGDLYIKDKEIKIKEREIAIKERELALKEYETYIDSENTNDEESIEMRKATLEANTRIKVALISANAAKEKWEAAEMDKTEKDGKASEMAELVARSMTAPKKKIATAIRQPDGSFTLSSLETTDLQQ